MSPRCSNASSQFDIGHQPPFLKDPGVPHYVVQVFYRGIRLFTVSVNDDHGLAILH